MTKPPTPKPNPAKFGSDFSDVGTEIRYPDGTVFRDGKMVEAGWRAIVDDDGNFVRMDWKTPLPPEGG